MTPREVNAVRAGHSCGTPARHLNRNQFVSTARSRRTPIGLGQNAAGLSLPQCIRCATGARSDDVEVALVHLQLGHGHMLQHDRVVRIGGDYNIAMPIVLRGGEKGLNICEYRVIDLEHVSCGLEICDRVVTKPRGKDE